MIEQTLTVSELKGNTAWLISEQKPACEGCNGKCGSQVFSKLFGTHKKAFPLPNSYQLNVGQKVKLALDDSKVVQHALWVYLLPLLMAFLGMFSALLIFSLPELGQIGFAIVFAAIGFVIAKMKGQSLKHEVKVIKIYPISLPVTQIDGD
ncbi:MULTISPECIES: SoxR reducing system RseC family protein [Pseudoalteromonas]|uniref:SoxR reducing system RseC family protein n=1 Tax=Pseudoalteromonas obscura TaxID=3048491 RepID=A0ABT7EHF7_9GAMM|nr:MULTISPECIES: SoxR reducing system RseC family protein [Pseudoalteromonas]MBQ4836128.1 SoxR reducing system RseC family protein [Pseudoalteromonas luteoviolacea]MDK2594476.1 SoxR reducing system RseC family protein [Pseudoalteromonas sp. P94(2023)]